MKQQYWKWKLNGRTCVLSSWCREEPLLKCTLEEADVRCGPRLPEIYRPRHMEVDGGIQLVSTGPQRAHSSKQRKEWGVARPRSHKWTTQPNSPKGKYRIAKRWPFKMEGGDFQSQNIFVFYLLKFGSLWFECLLGFVMEERAQKLLAKEKLIYFAYRKDV